MTKQIEKEKVLNIRASFGFLAGLDINYDVRK